MLMLVKRVTYPKNNIEKVKENSKDRIQFRSAS